MLKLTFYFEHLTNSACIVYQAFFPHFFAAVFIPEAFLFLKSLTIFLEL